MVTINSIQFNSVNKNNDTEFLAISEKIEAKQQIDTQKIIKNIQSTKATSVEEGPGDRYILVQPGEKLVDIAKRYGVLPQDLAGDNDITLNGPENYIFKTQCWLVIKNIPAAKQAELATEDVALYAKYTEAGTADKFGAFIEELYRSTSREMPDVVSANLKNPTKLLAMMGAGAAATYALKVKQGGTAGKVVIVLGVGFVAFDAGRLTSIMKQVAFNCETIPDAKRYAKNVSGDGVASAQFILDFLATGTGAAVTNKAMNVSAAKIIAKEARLAEGPKLSEAPQENLTPDQIREKLRQEGFFEKVLEQTNAELGVENTHNLSTNQTPEPNTQPLEEPIFNYLKQYDELATLAEDMDKPELIKNLTDALEGTGQFSEHNFDEGPAILIKRMAELYPDLAKDIIMNVERLSREQFIAWLRLVDAFRN